MLKLLLLSTAVRWSATETGSEPGPILRSPDEPGQKTVKDAAKEAAEIKANPAAKIKSPRKGKAVKADHKPADVKATAANPQKSIVPVRFKERYAKTGDSCGDRVALALKTYTTGRNADGRECCDEAKLAEVAEANGIDMKAYFRCNVGQKRMNIGNRLRGFVKNEQTVIIGKQKFADWDKAKVVDKSAWDKPEPKAKKAKSEPKAEQPAQAA